MKKIIKFFFFSFLSVIILITFLVGEDPAWVNCSDENDLYRYVYNGWKVEKVIKDYKGNNAVKISAQMFPATSKAGNTYMKMVLSEPQPKKVKDAEDEEEF